MEEIAQDQEQNQNQNQNINPNQSRYTSPSLVIIFWIYTFIHLIYELYYWNKEGGLDLRIEAKFNTFMVLLSLFISSLSTAIIVTLNYICNMCKWYICIIPSVVNELILSGIFLLFIQVGSNSSIIVILLIFFVYAIESLPNIILYIHICVKSRKENIVNLDNINNNLLRNDD